MDRRMIALLGGVAAMAGTVAFAGTAEAASTPCSAEAKACVQRSCGRLVQAAPTFSAGVITLLGVGLTVQALGTFPGGVPLIG